VNVGVVTVGSEHPIRVQTMTTTDTKDVQGTVEQVFIQLISITSFSEPYLEICRAECSSSFTMCLNVRSAWLWPPR
jgi:4-hydroxy-3-methylbut-2-en-1-yl diphosphate synthase IspG/GcpE